MRLKKYNQFITENKINVEIPLPNDIIEISNAYIKTGKDIPDIKVPTKTIEDLKKTDVNYSEAFTKYLMERGYDGVIDEMSATKQYVVFDPSQIKTRSQLNDIWKKANNK